MLRKVALDPHLELDQQQSFTPSWESLLAHAYQVWLTSIDIFLSYSADKHADKHKGKRNTYRRKEVMHSNRGIMRLCAHIILRITGQVAHNLTSSA